MLPAARVELLEPKPQKPSYRLLLQLAVAKVQNALNEANNTHRAWAIDDTTLAVVSGVEEYPLNVSGVGKVLDVVSYDPTNIESTERQIPFYDLSEMNGDFRGTDGASRVTFFRRGGRDALYARVRPIPTDTATYRVSFNIGSWSEGAALDDEPFLTAHHHYIVCDFARDALPGSEWFDDEKKNEARRKSLDVSLSRRVEKYYEQFKLGIASLTVPRNTMRVESHPIE